MLVASLAGLAAGGAFAATALGIRPAIDWLLAAFVLAIVEATVLTIAIGAVLRRYEPWALLVAVAIWTGVLGLAVMRRPTVGDERRRTSRAAFRAARQLAGWQRLIVLVAAAMLTWRLLLAVVLPPYAYDAIFYHLTIVAQWIQRGELGVNTYAECCSHYPSGTETLFAWPALFLHDDLLVDCVQIVLAVLGALAVAGLGRWAGLDAPAAVTAGAIFALTPIVLLQANTNFNDVAFAAFFLSATFFVARLLDWRNDAQAPSLGYAIVAGAATGLALGTKTSGLVVAVVLGSLVCIRVGIRVARRLVDPRRALGATGVFLGAMLVVGGWWYGRNWVETGNPVWPFDVGAAGVELFDGPAAIDDYLDEPPGGERHWLAEVGRSWRHDLSFWESRSYTYEQRLGGLGPLWSWLGGAAVTLFAVQAIRRRRDVAVNLLLVVVLVFLLLPYKWWSRFTIVVAAIGAIAVVALVVRLGRGPLRSALVASVLVLAVAGAAQASRGLDPASRGSTLGTADILALARHPLRERTVGTLFFPEYAFVDDLPSSASVAVELDAPAIRFLYPFFGRGLDRKVTLLRPGDETRLAARLAVTRSQYVVVGAASDFDRRLRDRASRYERIFDERDVRVYRVLANG